MDNRTTDLDKIKHGAEFTWGYLLKLHEIGEYAIAEYHPWKVDDGRLRVGEMDETMRQFSCYINGKSLGQSAMSLDEALALCIAYKHEGANHRAAYYFMKMVKE